MIPDFLRRLGKRVSNSQFARHVLIVMSGTVLAQALPILISPLLTRIYSPEDFGLFGLYTAVGSIVAIASSGRYEKAILLPESDDEALNVILLALAIAGVVACLSLIVVLLCHGPLVRMLDNEGIGTWLYTIPIFIVSSQIYQTFYYWWNRHSHYKRIAASRVLQSLVTALLSLLLGLSILKSGGLIIAVLAGQLVAGLSLGYFTWKNTNGFQAASWTQMKRLAKRYVGFAKYSVPADFINTASSQVPLILLSTFFGATVTGYFSLTQRVLGAPISVIATSVLDVFKQRAASDYAKTGNCRHIFVETMKHLLLLSIVPFVFLFVFSPYLFSTVFGPEWREAGDYARLLAPLFFLRFTVSPLSYVLYIAEKQKYDLAWQVGLFVATSGAIIIGHRMDSAPWSVGLFSLAYSLMYLIYLRLSYTAARGTL